MTKTRSRSAVRGASFSSSADEVKALALAKLASSGLTMADAIELGFELLTAEGTARLHPSFERRASLKLPYLDPLTGQPLAWAGRPSFYRLRYLQDPPANEFGAVPENPRRYTNEPGAGVCAYFPLYKEVDWPALLADPDRSLRVTEGELKAAKATKEGFPTIGLGGVFNFASHEYDVPFLDELEQVAWAGRVVYIVYDSDLQTNPNVCLALNRLARELQARGAQVLVVFLPAIAPGGKTGLDDFFMHDPDPHASFLELQFTASPLTNEAVLHQLNASNVFIYESAAVWSTLTEVCQLVRSFEVAYAQLTYEQRSLKPAKKEGDPPEVVRRRMPATAAWLRWPLRREVGKLSYVPGAPPGYLPHPSGQPELSTWNLWPGFAAEPRAGDVTPFLTLVDHLFKDVDPALRTWFLRWCAYPIQHPGAKLYTAVVIYGRLHGTGKSLVGATLGSLYGPLNYTVIGNEELNGKYNGWAARKQFILGDEITGVEKLEKRELADRLKRMITRETVRIDNKFEKAYELADCANYLFTSNHVNSFFIEDDDRRLFLHEMPQDVVLDEEDFFKVEYEPWLASGVGRGALLHYLQTLDLGDFNPNGRAPMTDAKRLAIMDSKSDLGAWIAALRENPDEVLGRVAPYDLYTNQELLLKYQGDDPNDQGRSRVSAQGFGVALRDAGFIAAHGGRPIIGREGKAGRYFIVRNLERWRHASPAELTAHLRGSDRAAAAEKVTPLKKVKRY